MGFSSIDDYLAKTTNLGVATALQTVRYDWNKVSSGTFSGGRWYDMSQFNGTPPANTYGELTVNGGPWNSAWGWTVGANWTFTVGAGGNSTFVHSATNTAAMAQAGMSLTNGASYLVIYTVAWTSGTVTVSLNGTNGTARGASGTFGEYITAGAAGGLAFTPTGTAALSISNISVVPALQSVQMVDTNTTVGAMYHGGNVSTKTKHVINAGVTSTSALGVTGTFMLVDLLMAYPGINLASTSPQTLTTGATLPRYADGIGVKAFFTYTMSTAAIPATLQNYLISYTNTTPTAGQTPSCTIANQGAFAGTMGQIANTGNAIINTHNPFMPLAHGDIGMTSVETMTISAAGTASTYGALVLCKPLCEVPITAIDVIAERNFMNQLPSLPRVYDGAYLAWLYMPSGNTVAATQFNGYIDFAWA